MSDEDWEEFLEEVQACNRGNSSLCDVVPQDQKWKGKLKNEENWTVQRWKEIIEKADLDNKHQVQDLIDRYGKRKKVKDKELENSSQGVALRELISYSKNS